MSIFIYTDNPSNALKTGIIKQFLTGFGLKVYLRGDLFSYLSMSREAIDNYKSSIDSFRISDIEKPVSRPNSKLSESEYFQTGTDVKRFFYDANWLQRILYQLFYSKHVTNDHHDDMHVVFTGKLFGTFGIKRYHARVVLAGSPSLVSTSGLVEAPARPREYYFTKAGFLQSGRDVKELDDMYKNSFIHYNDERITQVLCSYVLQVILYNFSGKEFCNDSTCCIYNSHWQHEVLSAQLSQNLCADCLRLLKEI